MYHWLYEGPVYEFDTMVVEKWKATTYAVSEAKALSNLAYRFKRKRGKSPDTKIKLPGKLKVYVGKDEYDD